MAGKNYSGNTGKINKTRRESDFYETPYSITQQFIEKHFRHKASDKCSILEPACGNGAIVKVLKDYYTYWNTTAYDLSTGKDFLEETQKYDYILTNPPFSLALEFILKAKEVAKEGFSFLLPLSYLHGEERFQKIYQDTNYPLTNVTVFTRYPMLGDPLRQDGKYRTGMTVYAWYTWTKHIDFYYNGPVVDWISNQEYVLSKKDK